jgi:formylglycine-generating enzyme required for sulfatase activity
MKMNSQTILSLAAALLLPALSAAAQENSDSNAPPLKDLMTTNSVVTNSVGLVLVKISPSLWVGKFDTTQDAYDKVMHGNPSAFSGPQKPVDSVSWDDATGFCAQLTAKEKLQLPDGYSYNLPTQAQWDTLVAGTSLKDAVMKFNTPNITSTAVVGSLGPNSLGLYDMRGNVWAWCLDAHDPSYHVLRGGAWDTIDEPSTRLVFRWYARLTDKPQNDFGFRVVLQSSAAQ